MFMTFAVVFCVAMAALVVAVAIPVSGVFDGDAPMVAGTKGSLRSTHGTAHMSERFHADENGRWFIWRENAREYLAHWQIAERLRWETRFGRRLRVRVRVKSAA